MKTKIFIATLFALVVAFALFPVATHIKTTLAQDTTTTTDQTTDQDQNQQVTSDEDENEEEQEPEEEEEDVDDVIKDVEKKLNKLPVKDLPVVGRFVLVGKLTAVNVAQKTVAVNGVEVDVSEARIRGGLVKDIGDLKVGSKVVAVGLVKDGVLSAKKLTVRGIPAVVSEKIEKLRAEINKRIQEILEQIRELQKKLNERMGGKKLQAEED